VTTHRTAVARYWAHRWSCRACPEGGDGYLSKAAAQADADAHERAHGGPGVRPRVFVISSTDIGRCPRRSLLPSHYEDDGTCLCPADRRVFPTTNRRATS
jgi:hypothetical protein